MGEDVFRFETSGSPATVLAPPMGPASGPVPTSLYRGAGRSV